MYKIRVLFIFLITFSLLTACSLGEEEIATCTSEGLAFVDDFNSEQNCGWAMYNRGGTVVEIAEGSLQISTSQPGEVWWTNPGKNFDDVTISVQARQLSGPDDNAYGVICRYQNEANFYIFLISGDGYYAIGKYQSGSQQVTYLTGEGQYQFSDLINQGATANLIQVGCIGNELSLAVNGLPVATVTDPTFVTGDIGLGVSTFQLGTAVVQFDDVKVVAPLAEAGQ